MQDYTLITLMNYSQISHKYSIFGCIGISMLYVGVIAYIIWSCILLYLTVYVLTKTGSLSKDEQPTTDNPECNNIWLKLLIICCFDGLLLLQVCCKMLYTICYNTNKSNESDETYETYETNESDEHNKTKCFASILITIGFIFNVILTSNYFSLSETCIDIYNSTQNNLLHITKLNVITFVVTRCIIAGITVIVCCCGLISIIFHKTTVLSSDILP
jgi:hypothetical protein